MNRYVYEISSRYLQKWLSYDIEFVKNSHFSRHVGTSPQFSWFNFLTDFDVSKKCFRSFFAFVAKPKNMHHGSKSRNFVFDLFYLVT